MRPLFPALFLSLASFASAANASAPSDAALDYPFLGVRKAHHGAALDDFEAGDEHRKVGSLCLSLMDRMGVKLPRFGDADTRLANI